MIFLIFLLKTRKISTPRSYYINVRYKGVCILWTSFPEVQPDDNIIALIQSCMCHWPHRFTNVSVVIKLIKCLSLRNKKVGFFLSFFLSMLPYVFADILGRTERG